MKIPIKFSLYKFILARKGMKSSCRACHWWWVVEGEIDPGREQCANSEDTGHSGREHGAERS